MQRSSFRTGFYFLSLAGLIALYFEFWRAVLLIATHELGVATPPLIIAQAFLVGWRFDFAVASYIAIALVVLGSVPGIDIARSQFTRRIHAVVLAVVIAIVSAVHLADIEFFRYFNVRLNGSALLWNDYPTFVAPMLWKMYPVAGYLVLVAVMIAGCLWAASRMRTRILNGYDRGSTVGGILTTIVLLLVFIVGARGRIEEKSPLRWGVAYFSNHDYANQLALNPSFTFFHDVLYDVGSVEQVELLMTRIDDPDAAQVAGELLGVPVADDQRIHRRVTFSPPSDSPPNVIIVIMESFGASAIGVLDSHYDMALSPRFDSLAAGGILFASAYSAGQHTYSGIFATLYGYPPGFGNLVMKENRGRSFYWGLPQILREHGYRTMFFTTSDPHFDNMQGFLMANGVEHVSSLFDYDPKLKLSTLGVPDHVMFDHAIDVLRTHRNGPFLATLLTGSNHGPWTLPDVDYGALPENTPGRERLNAFKYSDWALGRFVQALESDSAFANTLLVITADNGLLRTPGSDLDLTQYHIPILLYRIGSPQSGRRFTPVASQIDIVATVMGQVELDYDDYTFGRDLLDSAETRSPFVLFSEWYRIGLIEDGYYGIVRIGGPTSLFGIEEPTRDIAAQFPGQSANHRRRALAFYQTAFHNARLPLHNQSHVSTD